MKPVRLDESFGLPQVILTRSLCFVLRSLQARDVTYNVGLPSQKNILMEHVILIFLHKAAQLKHFFSYSGQRWMRDIYFIIQWKGHTHTQRDSAQRVRSLPTFYNEVEQLWPWVALTLNGARVLAVIGYIHPLYLKAVLVFVSDAWHNGHTWVHRPLVISCKYDAWAIQPGSFWDPIQ